MSATLASIREDVRSHVDEGNARFWENAELDRWIHEALRDIARRAEILPDTHAYTVKAEQETYDFPPDVLRIHRVEYRQTSTNRWALEFRPILEMDDLGLTQGGRTGRPRYWSSWGAPGGSQQLRLYPIPSETIAGGLVLFYYRLPHKPVNDADLIDLPSGWTDLVPLYVEYVARRKDNDRRWSEAHALYEERLAQMISVTRHQSDQATYFSAAGGFGGYGYNEWDY